MEKPVIVGNATEAAPAAFVRCSMDKTSEESEVAAAEVEVVEEHDCFGRVESCVESVCLASAAAGDDVGAVLFFRCCGADDPEEDILSNRTRIQWI